MINMNPLPFTGTLPELTPDEMTRYSRHLILPEVGLEGQRRLKNARVLLVGAGGLGAPLGMYLAAAGVGHIGIVDYDLVDASNLQRQIIHGTRDIGRLKIESARDRMLDINPHINVHAYESRLTARNALDLIREYDVVVDGTDNFPTRYLVNDACVLLDKPNVYGSIFRFEGHASVFWKSRGACYRCLYPQPPAPGLIPSCAEGGVLGVLPGIIGAIQATETIKLIIGCGEPLINRLLIFDALKMSFREMKLKRDPACPICGETPSQRELVDYEQFCGLQNTLPTGASGVAEMSVRELKRWLDEGRELQLIDVREPYEFAIARLPSERLIPLNTVVQRMGELDPSREAIVFCRSGGRSMKAIGLLREAGYRGALVNLIGGTLAWSAEVDPSVPQY